MTSLARLALAFTLAGPVPAMAGTPGPTLRSEVVVPGEVVRLGDLFQNAGRYAEVPVFRSPDPGHTGQLPAWRVIETARRIGLEPTGVERHREVTITRDARVIPLADMEERIAQALAASLGLTDTGRIQVSFERGTRPIAVETDASGSLDIVRIEHDPRSGRFDAVLGIRGSSRSERGGGFRVAGTANELVEYVVPARTIGRGEVVRASDLVVERRPRNTLTMLGGDTVVSLVQAVGLAARRPLTPERMFRTVDLMKPELVERNGNVLITVQLPGLSLTMRGKALEAGAEGDVIQVENLQSRKKLQAVVTGLHRVAVVARAAAPPAEIAARTQ